VATVPLASVDDVRRAYTIALGYSAKLTRYERSAILQKASALLRAAHEEASTLSAWNRACAGRTSLTRSAGADVLVFGANEALRDDGRCSRAISRRIGKKRKVDHHARTAAGRDHGHHAVQSTR
jgi:acyl-CoA reductase-like NAD-dependent aldehyde dehydrogenase